LIGLPGDRFVFLFNFDFLSILNRKNPIGLIDAFCEAFAHDEGPLLVIKTINGSERLVDLELLRYRRGHRTDIMIWDEYLPRSTQGALMSHCDAYVSLHRAEGLGLTMSEAMCLGKPVIATAYSGNVDFMDDTSAFLVPWQPVKIGSGSAPYSPTATWAEPSLDIAATHMWAVCNDPERARSIGAAAQLKLADEFSAEACGIRMRDRLDVIWRNR
jgi:glycosyltransferase involved in cell wall biosynthesis